MKEDRPSATARLIAAATLVASRERDLRELVPPDAAEWSGRFLGTSTLDRSLRLVAGVWPGRQVLRGIARLLLPGIVSHFQLRKRHIEQAWREAREDSFTQLIVLGAGLDSLGVRAADDPSLRVVEVDHPATQAIKRRVLPLRANLVLVPTRLDGGSHNTVLRAALDPNRPTFIVAEGLLMYLGLDQVRELLREMRGIVRSPIRFLGTFMQRWPDGAAGFRPQNIWVEWWLKGREEPFLWGAKPHEIEGILGAEGWVLRRLTTGEQLRAGGRWHGCVGEVIFEASPV